MSSIIFQKSFIIQLTMGLVIFLHSCLDDTGVSSSDCTEGTKTSCTCSDGKSGYRYCNDYGYYGSCDCKDQYSCTSTSDCLSGEECKSGVCAIVTHCAKGTKRTCKCSDGGSGHQICGINGIFGGCSCETPNTCTRSADCLSYEKCEMGECIPRVFEEECFGNNDCPSFFECVQNVCKPKPECEKNSDCPASQSCSNGQCTPDSPNGSFQIINRSQYQISGAKLQDDAGNVQDKVPSNLTIGANQDYLITNIRPGPYSISVKSADGCTAVFNNLLISVGKTANWVILNTDWRCESPTGSLKVTNSTPGIIGFIYLVSPNSSNWGDDYLKGKILKTGESFVIKNLTPGRYDGRVENELEDEYFEETDIEIKKGITQEWEITYLVEISE